MTTINFESESSQPYTQCASNDQLKHLLASVSLRFECLIKAYVKFHLFFLILGSIEIVLMAIFFTYLVQSALLAFSLALVFVTFFSFFILRLYMQTQKPDQLKELHDQYVEACKRNLGYLEGYPDHHIALANACCKLANGLHGKEYEMFSFPSWTGLKKRGSLEKFNCWWLWQDVHKMKELLLQSGVEEQLKLVKCQPTSSHTHAALANAYVMLSGLYANPAKIEGYDADRWLPEERFSSIIEEKFRLTAGRAIEEFKIISAYAPHDPWVHKQLAYSYHDLQMPEEEIKEYETILDLDPSDKETLYKLGVLYFQQGLNAQGLQVYENLKQIKSKKADQLINYYGSYRIL